jgi:hypothetical protein
LVRTDFEPPIGIHVEFLRALKSDKSALDARGRGASHWSPVGTKRAKKLLNSSEELASLVTPYMQWVFLAVGFSFFV